MGTVEPLLKAQRVLADFYLQGPPAYVCMGHTHAPGVSERPGGRLINLGDWEQHRTFAVVDEDVSLMQWSETGWAEVAGPPASRLSDT